MDEHSIEESQQDQLFIQAEREAREQQVMDEAMTEEIKDIKKRTTPEERGRPERGLPF